MPKRILPKKKDFPDRVAYFLWMAEHYLNKAVDWKRVKELPRQSDRERVRAARRLYEELMRDPEVAAAVMLYKGEKDVLPAPISPDLEQAASSLSPVESKPPSQSPSSETSGTPIPVGPSQDARSLVPGPVPASIPAASPSPVSKNSTRKGVGRGSKSTKGKRSPSRQFPPPAGSGKGKTD